MIEWIGIAALAFFCETLDSSLGGGYGTILTPVLLLLGYEPLEVVPLILFSEILTGLSAGALHHRAGNVDLSFRSRENRAALTFAGCGVAGTVLAVGLAVSLPATVVKGYIAFLLLGLGMLSLLSVGRTFGFSWRRVAVLGLVASFNKGMSGGGYGPLVTGGQVFSGLPAKSAIGITSLAEGLTCIVGLGLYLVFRGPAFHWALGLPLLAGSLLSVPFSVNLIRLASERFLRRAIALAILALGLAAFLKTFGGRVSLATLPVLALGLVLGVLVGVVVQRHLQQRRLP